MNNTALGLKHRIQYISLCSGLLSPLRIEEIAGDVSVSLRPQSSTAVLLNPLGILLQSICKIKSLTSKKYLGGGTPKS